MSTALPKLLTAHLQVVNFHLIWHFKGLDFSALNSWNQSCDLSYLWAVNCLMCRGGCAVNSEWTYDWKVSILEMLHAVYAETQWKTISSDVNSGKIWNTSTCYYFLNDLFCVPWIVSLEDSYLSPVKQVYGRVIGRLVWSCRIECWTLSIKWQTAARCCLR